MSKSYKEKVLTDLTELCQQPVVTLIVVWLILKG